MFTPSGHLQMFGRQYFASALETYDNHWAKITLL
jgi:hypothetical protein